MATAYEIATSPEPQSFEVELPTGAVTMTLRFNEQGPHWQLDIRRNGALLVAGAALVPGVDTLKPYPHLDFGGRLELWHTSDPSLPVGAEDLGVNAALYFIVE